MLDMSRIVRLFILLNILVIIITLTNVWLWISSKMDSGRNFQQYLELLSGRKGWSWSENSFRCYDDSKSVALKDFYRLDCENPFLRKISKAKLTSNDDVCDLFNEPIGVGERSMLYDRIKMDFQHFTEKITHADIMSMEAACPECHHIQIIDGELFIVHRSTAANFQTRSRSLKGMLKQLIDTFKHIGNCEMFIHLREYNIGQNTGTVTKTEYLYSKNIILATTLSSL